MSIRFDALVRASTLALVVFALTLAPLAGCTVESDGGGDDLGTMQQRLITSFQIDWDTLSAVNEGDIATLDIRLLCVNPATPAPNELVDVVIDWDGTAFTDLTPTNLTLMWDGSSPPAIAGDACPVGSYVVCDAAQPAISDAGCENITFQYPDNAPAPTNQFTVRADATHRAGGTAFDTEIITVSNLNPVVGFTRTGGLNEGDVAQYEGSVNDPALVADEIASVVWVWSPAGNPTGTGVRGTANPTTITCDCTQPVLDDQCVDQDLLPLPGGDSLCIEVNQQRPARFLNQGAYTATLTITDKDGGTASRVINTNVANVPPGSISVTAGGIALSTNSASRTPLTEGTPYLMVSDFTEPGTDRLSVAWDFDADTAPLTRSGSAEVWKNSYPKPLQALSPADIVANFSYIWDDGLRDPTLTVTDETSGNTGFFFIDVADVDPRITSFTASETEVNESEQVTFTIVTASGAVVPSYDPIRADGYIWQVDGSDLPATYAVYPEVFIANEVVVLAGCGQSDLTCTLQFLDADTASTYDVDCIVTDEDSTTSTADIGRTISVDVDNVAPSLVSFTVDDTDLLINEGDTINVEIEFADPAGTLDGDYSVLLRWGTDATDTQTEFVAAPGLVTGYSFTYADNKWCDGPPIAGGCVLSVVICETGVTPPCTSYPNLGVVRVSNLPPVPSIDVPVAGAFIEEGVPFALQGSYTDVGADLDDSYTHRWSWTDGSNGLEFVEATDVYGSSIDWLAADPQRFDDVPATNPTAAITLRVTDGDGDSGIATVNVNLVDNTPTVSVDSISLDNGGEEPSTPTATVTVAPQTSSDLLTRINISWGDGNSDCWVDDDLVVLGCDNTLDIENGGTFALTKAEPYADNNTPYNPSPVPYLVTATVWDEDSSAVDDDSDNLVDRALVINVVPTITDLQPPAGTTLIISEGQAASFVVTATDVAVPDRPGLRFNFLWGDGSPLETVTGIYTDPDNVGRAAHIYPGPGSYTVTINVTDKDGGESIVQTVDVEVVNVAPTITDTFNTGPVTENFVATVVALVDNRGADPLEYTWNTRCDYTDGVTDLDFPVGSSTTTPDPVFTPVQYTQEGDYGVCVRVCDDDGAANSCDYDFTVINVLNAAPEITVYGNLTGAPNEASGGATVNLEARAIDASMGGTDRDDIVFTFDCGNGDPVTVVSNTYDAIAGDYRTTHGCVYDDSGSYMTRVTAADDGASVFRTLGVTVVNLPPANLAVSAEDVDEGSATTVRASGATDIAADLPLTYRYDFQDDGVFDVTTTNTSASYRYPSDGTHAYRVRVCDDDGGCSDQTGNAIVLNVAPAIASLSAPASITEGNSLAATVVASDVGGDPLLYKWNMECDTLTPSAADFSGAGTVESVATYTYANSGTYNICVEVCDNATPVECDYAARAVSVSNVPPQVNSFTNNGPVNEAPAPGAAVVLTVNATDAGADTLVYTFTCGDGSAPAPAGNTATCTYANSGTYTATVLVDDQEGGTDSSSTVVVVRNVAPVFGSPAVTIAPLPTTPEGQATTFTVSASDAAGDVITYSFDFDANGSYEVSGGSNTASYTYARDGSHAYAVRVCDADMACITSTGNVTVSNVAPAVVSLSAPSSTTEGNSIAATVVATDAGRDPLLYRWNLECSTSSPTAANFTGAGAADTVATWTYANSGTFNICVEVCDDAPACAYAARTINVVNLPPSVTSFTNTGPVDESPVGAAVTLTVTAQDPGADTLTYSFDCGDGTTSTQPAATFVCTYADSGTYTATVTVDDGQGGTASAITGVRVRNLAPAFGATPVDVLDVDEGVASDFSVDATDAGGDTLTYAFDFDANGSFEVVGTANTASYAYPTDGAKSYRVQVCDTDGACITANGSTLVRNVAPSIGSVVVPATVSDGSAVTVAANGSDVGGDMLMWTFIFRDSGGTQVGPTIGPQASNVASATMPSTGAYFVEVSATDTANAPNSAATTTFAPSPTFNVIDLSVAVTVTATPSSFAEGGSTDISVVPTGTGPYLVSYDLNGDGDFTDAVDRASVACAAVPCVETVTYAQNPRGDLPIRILVQVTDQGTGAVSTAFTTITVFNVEPTLAAVTGCDVNGSPVSPCSGLEGDAYTLTLVGSDNAADTLTYSLVSGPTGLTVDAAGAVSWTPTWDQAAAAPGQVHTVEATVTDSDGARALSPVSFDITVTIIDTNSNGISDTRELELNNGSLLPANAGTIDTDNDGISDLDEVLAGTDPNVSDAPTAPTVISPKDDMLVATVTPTLQLANAVSPRGLVLSYTFVVTEDDGTTEVGRMEGVASGSTVTEVVFTAGTLVEDMAYHWYGYADDGTMGLGGSPVYGLESNRGRFIINAVNDGPGAPDPITPIDGAVFVEGTRVSLEARAVADPDGDPVSYVFEVATADTFLPADVVATSAARSMPFYALPDPLTAGTYYWRAMASDGVNDSPWGASSSFVMEAVMVNSAPTMPGIVSPMNEEISSTSATLTITAATDPEGDTLQYAFEIANNAAFISPMTSGFQDGLTYSATGLMEDTAYYWRARASDGQLTSDWATAMFVVNADNGAPSGLVLLSPSDGALVAEAPARFVAALAEDPEGDTLTYDFELASDDAFTTIVAEGAGTVGDGIATWEPGALTLEEGATYYWRVTASDGTNDLTADAAFSVFEPIVVGTGGGCSCSASDTTGSPLFGLMMLVGVAVLRWRRRRS